MWRVWTRFVVERPATVLSGGQAVVGHSVLSRNLLHPSFKPSIWSNRCLSISSIIGNTYASAAPDKALDAKNSKDRQKVYTYDFLDFDNFLAQPGDSPPFDQTTRTGQRPTRTRRSRSRPAPRMGDIYSKEILLLDFQRICELEFISQNLGRDIIRNCGEPLRDVKPVLRIEMVHQFWTKLAARDYRFGVEHYNELLSVYNQCEHVFSPIEFLSNMKVKNIAPDKTTYIYLLEAYGLQGDIKAAGTILDYMKKEDMSISEAVYAALITGHARAGDLDNSYATFDLMRENNIMPSRISYSALLKAVAEKGEWSALQKVFTMMADDHIVPDRYMYSSVIKSLSRAKRSFLIPKLLDDIDGKESIFQSLRGTMIDLCNEEDLQGALFILKDIIQINTMAKSDDNFSNMTLRSLLRAVARLPIELKDKLDFIQDIEEIKLIKHPVLYDFLDVAHDNRDTDLAIACMQEMVRREVPVRSHFAYPMFVQYRVTQNIQGAVDLLHLMDSLKIITNKITYSIFMSCFGLNATLDDILSTIERHNIKVSLSLIGAFGTHLVKTSADANVIVDNLLPKLNSEVIEKQSLGILGSLKILNADGCVKYIKMLDSRNDMNSKIYAIVQELVTNFANNDNVAEAEKFVEALLTEGLGKYVTSVVHTRILSGLCRKMDEAAFFRYGRVMRDNKLSLDKHQYRVVLKMLAKLGKVDLAEKCFDELKGLNGLTNLCYSHLIFAYEKSKDYNNVLRLHDEMLEMGIQPVSAASHIIIMALQRAGREEEASTLRSIESESKDIMTMNTFVEAAASRMEIDVALEKLAEIKAAGETPLPFAYLSLLKACRNEGNVEKAYELFLEMKELNVNTPKLAFVILIGLFTDSQNFDRAREIFKHAVIRGKTPYLKSYEQMINLAIAKNDHDIAAKYVKYMREIFNVDYYEVQEILLTANLAANHVAIADNLYKQYLKSENSNRLIKRFKSLAKNCVRTNNVNKLQTLQEFTKRHHIPLDQAFLNEGLLLIHSNNNDVNQGINLYKHMKSINENVSERFIALLDSLLQKNNMDISEVLD